MGFCGGRGGGELKNLAFLKKVFFKKLKLFFFLIIFFAIIFRSG